MRPQSLSRGILALWVIGSVLGVASLAEAQLVPGTGNLLNYDDLEDANWGYTHNFPKSSKEEDENIRYPLGGSSNRMWSESPKRGSPDVIKRCETPAGGLAGSTGALYMRTRDSGIPGHPMNKQAQDDFILTARPCGVGYSPNYVVRVFLPEFQDWEQRQGVSFGIRAGMQGPMTKQKELSLGRRFLRGGKKTETVTETEPYYPGFFIAFNPMSANNKEPYAQVLIRSDHLGNEVPGPKMTQTGWWTFGMSVTPDARCHYYAHPGISDLTAKDHIYSSLPYNIRGEYFNTIFFNVCSADNGSSWSTPWIIDDPRVYYSGPPVFKQPQPQQAQQPQPVKTAEAPAAAPNAQNASMTKEIPAAPAAAPAAPPQAAPALTPAAQVPMAPAPAAQPAAPPMLQQVPTAAPMTSMRPAAVQVPVVGIPAVPAPAADEVVDSPMPAATATLTVIPSSPVPVAAPSAAALQQPAPISSAPSGPVQPIATLGVPVKAPSMMALSTPPAEFTGPVTAAVTSPPMATVQTIAPIPAPAPATFNPPVMAAPVSTSKAIPVRTATSTASTPATPGTIGIPVRPTSVPVSIEKPVTSESPAPVAPVAPAPIEKPVTSTPAPIPPVEPEPMETLEAPIMAETAVTQEPAPALLIPILPKEENIPAKQMGQAAPAPLVIPTLPSVNTEAAVSTTPEPSEASVPAAPVFEAAEPAANPFDDARKPASPETDSSVSSEEPPLAVLEPVVDTSMADPAPVPTPPVVE
jgi:hypothetical protein